MGSNIHYKFCADMNQWDCNYTEEDRGKVIDYYLSNTNNTVPAIKKALGYGTAFISNAIDKYFNEKFKKKKLCSEKVKE